jgi:hypothetical protein
MPTPTSSGDLKWMISSDLMRNDLRGWGLMGEPDAIR